MQPSVPSLVDSLNNRLLIAQLIQSMVIPSKKMYQECYRLFGVQSLNQLGALRKL